MQYENTAATRLVIRIAFSNYLSFKTIGLRNYV